MDNCVICLKSNDDVFSRITTLSSEWVEGKMQRIIEKHLWWWYIKPASPTNVFVQWICRKCWQEISTFHEFYCKVEMVHRQYRPILASMQYLNYAVELGDTIIKNEIENTVELVLLKEQCEIKSRKEQETVENIEQRDVCMMEEKSECCFDINECNDQHKDDNVYNVNELVDTLVFEDNKNELESDEDKPIINKVKKIKCKDKTKQKTKSECRKKKLQKKLKPKKPVKKKDDSICKVKQSDKFFKDSEHKLECCICNEQLTDFRAIKMHYRNEHNTQGYAMCCGKKYFKRCLLVDHLRVHSDPNFFKCQSCTKTFATRRGLEMHLESHKSRDRKFNCGECGKSYFKLHIFERHKLTHVPENERNFNCTQCDKKFASDYIRRQHEDSTHAKKYAKICDICGKSFCHSYSFLRHMEEHAGAPPSLETCEICGVKLTNKYGLRQHMKMRHLEENLQEQICPYCSRVSPNLNAHRMHIKYTHTMQRKHVCHLCDKAFRRPLELKEHLSTHTGEALYTCPHCPRTFISNANMHKHRKNVHRQEWEETRLKKLNERGRKTVTVSAAIDNDMLDIQNSPENLVVIATIDEHFAVPLKYQ